MVRCVSSCHPLAQRSSGIQQDLLTKDVMLACNSIPHDYWYLSRRVEYHVYSLEEGCFGSKKGSKTAERTLHAV